MRRARRQLVEHMSRLASLFGLLSILACGDATEPTNPVATTLTLSAATLFLSSIGESAQLTPTVRDQFGAVMSGTEVTWSSNDASVATVSASGLVTAVANGSAVISATSDQATGIATATILQAPATMTLSAASVSFAAIGQTSQLIATVTDELGTPITGPSVTWSSSDESVAMVSASGLVTSVDNGTATINATSGATSATAIATVLQVAASIVLDPDSVSFSSLADELQLIATVRDQLGATMDGAPLTWSSSNEDVVTVSPTGSVTAEYNGAATITAGSGAATATAIAIVEQVADTLTFLDDTVPLFSIGDTARAYANILDAGGSLLDDAIADWASSDEAIVTVDDTGLLTAVALGSTTVTATYGPVSATAEVTVYDGAVLSVSAGVYYTMFVKADNSLWGVGYNGYGQLGSSGGGSTPVESLSDVSTVSAGGSHTMIVKTDGTLWATGYNYFGQLGDGTTAGKGTPIQVMSDVASVSAGISHTMILKADGTLWATGDNASGQLGDGTTVGKNMPVQIMTDVAAVAAGRAHTMILKDDGTLWATGSNGLGALGDGTLTAFRSIPIQIMADVDAVAAGGDVSLIVKTDGTLWATGSNSAGQLGIGTTAFTNTPVQVTTDVADASTGGGHTMIVKTDGTLWATGANNYGQLGDGTMIGTSTPIQIMNDVATASVGLRHTMIIKTDGTLWAAGWNYYGQLGGGTTGDKSTPVQVAP